MTASPNRAIDARAGSRLKTRQAMQQTCGGEGDLDQQVRLRRRAQQVGQRVAQEVDVSVGEEGRVALLPGGFVSPALHAGNQWSAGRCAPARSP